MGKEQEQETVEVALDDMEKSFNDAKATVLTLLGEEPKKEDLEKSEETEEKDEAATEDLDKAKKKEDMEYEEEEDDEDEEEAEKSLSDSIAEEPEAEAAMDVEPFLNQLVKGLEEQFNTIQKSLAKVSKEVEGVRELQKATAKMVISSQELQKATAETVEKIGNEPVKSSSVLRKSGDKFSKSGDGEELEMSREEILEKATKLREQGKLPLREITKLEERLNKGMPIAADLIKKLKEVE